MKSRLFTLVTALLIATVIGAPMAAADSGTQSATGGAETQSVQQAPVKCNDQLGNDSVVVQAQKSVDQFADQNNLPHVKWCNVSSEEAAFGCGMSTSASFAYYYCPDDQTAYIGVNQEAYFDQGTDELAGSLLIAHEWGHRLQHAATTSATFVDDRAHENGADCVGGAWLKWFADRQGLQLNFGDVMGFWNLAVKIEAPVEMNDVHGTRYERAFAMFIGYTDGLGACNAMYARIFPSI